VEAQKRLGGAKFLVAGLTGLASEACKNVVLAGIGTMVLYDDGTPSAEAAPGNFLAGAGAADGAVRCAQAQRPSERAQSQFSSSRRPFRKSKRGANGPVEVPGGG
jgi:ubiquitin-like 1-activating enzyme E1 A